MKIKLKIIFILVVIIFQNILLLPSTFAFQSSQITNYKIKQCNKIGKCFQVESEVAFVSLGLESISAKDATLFTYDLFLNTKKNKYLCHSLSFNLLNQFLFCDNSDIEDKEMLSITIDSNFHIQSHHN